MRETAFLVAPKRLLSVFVHPSAGRYLCINVCMYVVLLLFGLLGATFGRVSGLVNSSSEAKIFDSNPAQIKVLRRLIFDRTG